MRRLPRRTECIRFHPGQSFRSLLRKEMVQSSGWLRPCRLRRRAATEDGLDSALTRLRFALDLGPDGLGPLEHLGIRPAHLNPGLERDPDLFGDAAVPQLGDDVQLGCPPRGSAPDWVPPLPRRRGWSRSRDASLSEATGEPGMGSSYVADRQGTTLTMDRTDRLSIFRSEVWSRTQRERT